MFTSTCVIHVSDNCSLLCTEKRFIFILQKELYCSIQQQNKKIAHRTRLRENDDLPLWRAPAIKDKAARASHT